MGEILIAAAFSAAMSAKQSKDQANIADKDREARELAAKKEDDRLAQIAQDTRPEDLGSDKGEIIFGAGKTDPSEGFNQFVVPKTSSLGAATGRSGLGFEV